MNHQNNEIEELHVQFRMQGEKVFPKGIIAPV